MFIYLIKKVRASQIINRAIGCDGITCPPVFRTQIAIPNGIKLQSLGWNPDQVSGQVARPCACTTAAGVGGIKLLGRTARRMTPR